MQRNVSGCRNLFPSHGLMNVLVVVLWGRGWDTAALVRVPLNYVLVGFCASGSFAIIHGNVSHTFVRELHWTTAFVALCGRRPNRFVFPPHVWHTVLLQQVSRGWVIHDPVPLMSQSLSQMAQSFLWTSKAVLRHCSNFRFVRAAPLDIVLPGQLHSPHSLPHHPCLDCCIGLLQWIVAMDCCKAGVRRCKGLIVLHAAE